MEDQGTRIAEESRPSNPEPHDLVYLAALGEDCVWGSHIAQKLGKNSTTMCLSVKTGGLERSVPKCQ